MLKRPRQHSATHRERQSPAKLDEKMAHNNSMVSTLNQSNAVRTSQSFFQRNRSGRSTKLRAQSPDLRSTNMDEDVFLYNKPNTAKPPADEAVWRQSASTWRHTSPRYSFSRDSRFKPERCSHLDIQELQLPSSLGNKSCTFGVGNKKPISIITLRNAKVTPSPDRYNLTTYLESTRNSELGKSFGMPWETYKNVYIRHRTDVYSGHFTQGNPPAHYEVRESPGKNKKKFSAYGRLKMFTQAMADHKRMIPGPVHKINELLVRQTKGLNERNFGFGERIDLAKPLNDNPSPDTYNVKRFYQSK